MRNEEINIKAVQMSLKVDRLKAELDKLSRAGFTTHSAKVAHELAKAAYELHIAILNSLR